ncbi:30S ribosomal protein S12 methylthiotransferase RimO [Anaerosalibacter massiliensis]|uniref:Ribosomal protein uS12 methylthiotransferase RimO n=1 Tax=Anaerosalibacter massiliensis TaxID=1347392 RepID=A0A9X2MGL6_9FIRM|nr:30S ribosomal protein S12 methylthiotransferase RimO [Anaerosalibacter massiliensis]MCR2042715.1 30S ribosomal protein S12 methylthiotransferase RimO [Anaerosalibacter massiliensis]
MDTKNIAIITLGCSKNEIDSDLMTSILLNKGYYITDELNKADVIVINTCGFINDAKEESIEIIWEMCKYKEYGRCKYIVLAGCLAERYWKELMDEIKYVDGIIGTGNIKEIVNLIEELERKNKVIKVGNINSEYVEKPKRRDFNHTAYVKISEGCNNNCSYCIIPKLRGKYRSRKIEDIISEVEYLADEGVKEIILIAQNTTDYGIDLYGEYKLPHLLEKLNKIKKINWIRLLYMYPDNFNDNFIKAIKENDKVVKYLDIPIQHMSDKVLKNMNRKTTKKDITNLISKLRNEIPEIVIRTTIIVGFPGETLEQFNELYQSVEENKFDRLGVFTYSREEGTSAYNFKDQIDEETKKYRKDKIMELQKEISLKRNKEKLGKIYTVLVEEEIESGTYIGRTYMDSPEIDGLVYFNSSDKVEIGSFIKVRIVDYLEYDLMGAIIGESGQQDNTF